MDRKLKPKSSKMKPKIHRIRNNVFQHPWIETKSDLTIIKVIICEAYPFNWIISHKNILLFFLLFYFSFVAYFIESKIIKKPDLLVYHTTCVPEGKIASAQSSDGREIHVSLK